MEHTSIWPDLVTLADIFTSRSMCCIWTADKLFIPPTDVSSALFPSESWWKLFYLVALSTRCDKMCVHVWKLDKMETSAGKTNVGCCSNLVTHVLCSSLLSGSVWLWEHADVTASCKIYLGVYNKGDTELFCQISVNWSPKIYKTCISLFWVLISFREQVINRADMFAC